MQTKDMEIEIRIVIASDVGGDTDYKESRHNFPERCERSLSWSGWLLHGYTHLSELIKLYCYDLCILIYANFTSINV